MLTLFNGTYLTAKKIYEPSNCNDPITRIASYLLLYDWIWMQDEKIKNEKSEVITQHDPLLQNVHKFIVNLACVAATALCVYVVGRYIGAHVFDHDHSWRVVGKWGKNLGRIHETIDTELYLLGKNLGIFYD